MRHGAHWQAASPTQRLFYENHKLPVIRERSLLRCMSQQVATEPECRDVRDHGGDRGSSRPRLNIGQSALLTRCRLQCRTAQGHLLREDMNKQKGPGKRSGPLISTSLQVFRPSLAAEAIVQTGAHEIEIGVRFEEAVRHGSPA